MPDKDATQKPQIEKFREVARELGADDADEERFNAALEKVGKARPAKDREGPKEKPPHRS